MSLPPGHSLATPRNPLPALFPADFSASRARFQQDLALIRRQWPGARLESHPVNPEAAQDWIEADPLERPDRLLVITAGQHGIEAFAGSAVLQLAIEEILPALDPASTGLLLGHCLNPWGMLYHRRTNPHNVDLNRNFCQGAFDPNANPDYVQIQPFLNPAGVVGQKALNPVSFLLHFFTHLARLGPARFRQATLLGQYRYTQGIYFGGQEAQAETIKIMQIYRRVMRPYRQVVVLDIHTGYGPAGRMSLVNSAFEKRSPAELIDHFQYPWVVRTNPQEFYAIQGDMIDSLYNLAQHEFPKTRFYATSFEFGTLGDSIAASVTSLQTMILENRLYWFGAENPDIRKAVERKFHKLFAPLETGWQVGAMEQAGRAMTGILQAEGYLANDPTTK